MREGACIVTCDLCIGGATTTALFTKKVPCFFWDRDKAIPSAHLSLLRSAQLPVGPDSRGQKARVALYLHAGVENDGGRQGRVRVWGMGLADHRAVHHERWHRPLQPKVQPSWRHILARESPAGGWPQCHLPSRPGRNSQKSALRWLYIVKYTRALTFLRTSARLQRGRLSAEGWT